MTRVAWISSVVVVEMRRNADEPNLRIPVPYNFLSPPQSLFTMLSLMTIRFIPMSSTSTGWIICLRGTSAASAGESEARESVPISTSDISERGPTIVRRSALRECASVENVLERKGVVLEPHHSYSDPALESQRSPYAKDQCQVFAEGLEIEA